MDETLLQRIERNCLKTHKGSHLASVVNNTEIGIIFELLWLLEFGVVAQFLDDLLNK